MYIMAENTGYVTITYWLHLQPNYRYKALVTEKKDQALHLLSPDLYLPSGARGLAGLSR